MKNFKLFFLSLILVIIVSTSFSRCKNEPISDLRDQAIGSYKAKMEMFSFTDLEKVLEERNATFTVSRNENDTSAFDITVEGDRIIGTKIVKASKGFSFNIDKQPAQYDDGGKVIIEGYNYIELSGKKYHGVYNSDKNEFRFAIMFDAKEGGSNEDIGEVLISVVGIKK